jgi:hypothetical protein
MLAVPALTPDTSPVLAATVAMASSLLLQVPPEVELLSVLAWPAQITATPVFAGIPAFTVNVTFAEQLPSVYMIVVVPEVMPVTTPVTAFMVATDSSLLLHSPPVVAELKATLLPAQIVRGPVMVAGVAPVVTVIVLKQPAPVL